MLFCLFKCVCIVYCAVYNDNKGIPFSCPVLLFVMCWTLQYTRWRSVFLLPVEQETGEKAPSFNMTRRVCYSREQFNLIHRSVQLDAAVFLF